MYTLSKRVYLKIFPFIHALARVFGKNVYVKLYDRKVYYDPSTDIGQKLLRVGNFERAELAIIKKFITETTIAIDIGANIGTHALFFAHLATKGRVFAFEPSKNTYNLLLKNIDGVGNIFPVNMAASNKCGTAMFYNAIDNAYSGLKDTGKKPIVATENVLTVSLDDFAGLFNLDRIDFIKIDVEGNEEAVIEGAIETLTRHKPVVFAEICGGENLTPDPEKTINRVIGLGYAAYVIQGWNLVPFSKHDNDYYNYLFVPKGTEMSK